MYLQTQKDDQIVSLKNQLEEKEKIISQIRAEKEEMSIQLQEQRTKFEELKTRELISQLEEQKRLNEQIRAQTDQIREHQIDKLQQALIDVSQKPTVVQHNRSTQNNTYNLVVLDDDWFDQCSQSLNLDHLKQRGKGCGRLAVEQGIKDRVTCTDPSRKSLNYRTNDGIVRDPKGEKFVPRFVSAIYQRCREIISEHGLLTRDSLDSDDLFYQTQMSKDHEELLDTNTELKATQRGEDTDFKREFLNLICAETVRSKC